MTLALLLGLALAGERRGAAQAGAAAVAGPALPQLSGRYAVGRHLQVLVDANRMDPYAVHGGGHRELLVSTWYPAHASGSASAEYFPGAAAANANADARAAAQDVFGATVWPRIVSGALRSDAVEDAVPVRVPGGFPVVLFSHGSGASGFSYTAATEDLASHGYVVVAIEHTDAAGLVWFPDGRVRLPREPPAVAGGSSDPLQAMIESAEEQTETGAEDVRFVLNRLAGGPDEPAAGTMPLAGVTDVRRAAAVGHSYGGTVSARACAIDPRLKACVSEDGEVNPVGVFFDYPDRKPIRQPFLFVELPIQPEDEQLRQMGETRARWNAYLQREREQMKGCAAGSYWVRLQGAGVRHPSFSDGPLLNAPPGSPEGAQAVENLRVTEVMVRGFLDRVLKGEPGAFPKGALAEAGKTPVHLEVEPVGR